MKISIISATYNSADYIYDTYNSILEQSYSNWEWLVTDDSSFDNTWIILQKISNSDSRVKVFKNDFNQGAAVSRNVSLKNSSGKYIAFIDSDDIWYKSKLELQLKFMISNNISFSFTPFELIDENSNLIGKTVDLDRGVSFNYEDILCKRATLGCSTVMIKKDSFADISMPLLRTGQDYALWLKLLKMGHSTFLLNKVLTQYRITPGSISRNKFRKAIRQWHIYRVLEKLSLFKSFICFINYAWRALFRK